MSKYSLLVGNGINNINPGFSWGDLIDELTAECKVTIMSRDDKPFPLVFEEIYLNSIPTGMVRSESLNLEKKLKGIVAKFSKRINPYGIHRSICESNASHILTTNYDFSLQKSIRSEFNGESNDGVIKERKFNLFRKYIEIEGKTFWHIHGAMSEPESITLGYENYIGYSQRLRDYVVNGTDNSYKKKTFIPIERSIIKNKSLNLDSWVDLFFEHNVHIFGLGLSFVEIDLWWLLNYRGRLKSVGVVKNEVTYYCRENDVDENKSKFELLKAFGVRLVVLQGSGEEYYESVLKMIDNYENR